VLTQPGPFWLLPNRELPSRLQRSRANFQSREGSPTNCMARKADQYDACRYLAHGHVRQRMGAHRPHCRSCGNLRGGVLAPFAATRSHVVFAAPFAGILIVPLVANALYTLVGISFASAAQLSVAAYRSSWWLTQPPFESYRLFVHSRCDGRSNTSVRNSSRRSGWDILKDGEGTSPIC
jgi:hypothetical protein